MTQQVERMLPLYEAKMIHHFDDRWATFDGEDARDVTAEERRDPSFEVLPRYWVRSEVVSDRYDRRGETSETEGNTTTRMLGYRWISNATNERTFIASSFPFAAVGNSLPIFRDVQARLPLQALLSSYAFDFCARQKLGGQNMTFGTVYQLPMISPTVMLGVTPWAPARRVDEWLKERVIRLLSEWSDLRLRSQLLAELDAASFRLFGIGRQDVDYIMETFPIVKRKDIAAHGSFRTKEMILEVFDAMQEAVDSGKPYVSPLEASGVLASLAE